MTNKIQYTKKIPGKDDVLITIGGDTVEEFMENYRQMYDFLEEEKTIMEKSNGNGVKPDTGNYPGDTFPVENIKLASGGEHPRWVVQGGNFSKFGVTCWPETLENAGILKHLDPLKDNNPSGSWVAHYQKKVDGKPDKVVKLERVGA